MPQYLVRLVQTHPTFRKAELEALAVLEGLDIEILEYTDETPFCILNIKSDAEARKLLRRSIVASAIYELWAQASTYDSLHSSIRQRTSHRWPAYKECSFRFSIDCFRGKRSVASQRNLIESFSYLGFDGQIVMAGADEVFTIFEQYDDPVTRPFLEPTGNAPNKKASQTLQRIFFGRYVAKSGRDVVQTYDLKKRLYISTTSMDAELALVTANLALAGPGKLFFDPFTGTGGFPIAAAHFGAMCMGADIDGRAIRGKEKEKNVVGNFKQYGLSGRYLDGFISDLTNTPLRTHMDTDGRHGLLDGIVCDPPYGVREGLKVLGRKDGDGSEPVWVNGGWAHLQDNFIAPKKPYSFDAMLDDILEFSAIMLVENGRISMWMPTANDEDVELSIPSHEWMELVSVCVQPFNRWSRRLLTYRRRSDLEIDRTHVRIRKDYAAGKTADALNQFRKKYFEGFKEQESRRPEENMPQEATSSHV